MLATATYGFGSIVADRSMGVDTTSDDGAYLQYEAEQGIVVTENDSTVAFHLTNDLTEAVELTVTTTGTASDTVTVTGPDTLAAGATGDYEFSCGPVTSATGSAVTVEVEATGASTDVTMTREVDPERVDCVS